MRRPASIMPPGLRVGLLVGVVLAATACSGSSDVEVEVAAVTAGEVMQTVAAAGELQAADSVTVTAPAGGEVAELLVADGDRVDAGDPLVRLASDSLEQQIEQAEVALSAAEDLAASASGAGIDLSPVVGSFTAQLEAVFPPLLGVLADSVAALEDAATSAEQAQRDLQADVDEARRQVNEQLDEQLDDQFADRLTQVGPPAGAERDRGPTIPAPDPDASAAPDASADTDVPAAPDAPDVVDAPDVDTAPDISDVEGLADALGEVEIPALDVPAAVDADRLRAAAADGRARLAQAEAGYREARAELARAEEELVTQAAGAAATQVAAATAQADQAELALEAARARADELLILAPMGGIVELARGEASAPDVGEGTAAGLEDLDGLAQGGELGALSGLLAPRLDGGSIGGTGRLAEGVGVGIGQTLLTIFDLSGFEVLADVDEIDIVEMEVGQSATVLVDAFPDAEIDGTVRHIALSPRRQAGGGALYPVTVELGSTDEELRLRIGMTTSVEVEVRRVRSETVVPTSALLRRGGSEVVYVVRDGIADEIPVVVEAMGDDSAAITGDLAVGDEVVTIGVELVEDGTSVEIVP